MRCLKDVEHLAFADAHDQCRHLHAAEGGLKERRGIATRSSISVTELNL
jgi:hypothetical protein